jgi:hypothetical protein
MEQDVVRLVAGVLFAVAVVLAIFVSRDARRRGMSKVACAVWAVLVFLNWIIFGLLYLLLRKRFTVSTP